MMKPRWMLILALSIVLTGLTVASYLFTHQWLKDRQALINSGRRPPLSSSPGNAARPPRPTPPQPPPYQPTTNTGQESVQRTLNTLNEINRINEMNRRLMEQQQRAERQNNR